jgi:hypothetical protein
LDHRLYVDSAATGLRTGESWANAFTQLQEAIDLSKHCPDVTEIWVAAGMYLPTLNNQASSFNIPPGLRIYGGFNGTETDLGQQNPEVNQTILSGDIGLLGQSADNAYRVVTIPTSGDTITLNGVTIKNGSAFGPLVEQKQGAGIYSTGNLNLTDCIIEDCMSLESGGGIYHSGPGMTIKLTNCTLRNNATPHILNEGGGEIIISNTNRLKTNE